MLKKLKLAAGEVLRSKAVSSKVRQFEEKKQAEVARLRSKMKCHKGQPAPCSTAVSSGRSRDDKKHSAGSNGNNSGGKAPKIRKRNVAIRRRECRCSVARYMNRLFGF